MEKCSQGIGAKRVGCENAVQAMGMKILLLGEYSNVHATLAEGLRKLGHEVCVMSDGDNWKNYPRDVDLSRQSGFWGRISFLWRLMKALPRMRGYDVVQVINPMFLELKAERMMPFYRYLRHHNRHMVMGAFGLDYYWVSVNYAQRPMRYSDFNIGDKSRDDAVAMNDYREWVGTARESLTKAVAADADAIVAGLYEYFVTYELAEEGRLRDKLSYIPFPIVIPENVHPGKTDGKLRVFIGISKGRSAYKGTDIMLAAAREVEALYPERMELRVAEGVPFDEYRKMINDSDVLIDQLYGYSPAMNALLAMSKGIVVVGGGEPEHYDLLGEHELRPIVNVEPTRESVFKALESLVLHPEQVDEMKRQSVAYVRRHYDCVQVARQYERLYLSLIARREK